MTCVRESALGNIDLSLSSFYSSFFFALLATPISVCFPSLSLPHSSFPHNHRWLSEGKLQVRIAKTFGLEDAAEAHRFLESRSALGKVLLHV
jgi:hypothetical protein